MKLLKVFEINLPLPNNFSTLNLLLKSPKHMSDFLSLISECLYADDTELVGEGNTLNPEPLAVLNTAECIDACIKTWGCRYWTVTKSPKNASQTTVECDLKSWKGRRSSAPGYISGSLPSACCKYNDRF